ncbi:MAG TPA: type II secretion system F family protein [Verrucomicrobiae bacterium]|nr:type II secretion system F family protein [Verrucomicrobiae bacterium]
MDWTYYLLQVPLMLLMWLLFGLGPFAFALWLGYYFMSLRLRRQERARFLLDMVETGLKEGRRPEDTIISVAYSHDSAMSAYFYLAAAYLEKGLSLREALENVPQLLPPQITAMLQTGLRLGDIQKVLPACRRLFKDAVSQTRGAINYLMLLAFVGLPTNIVIFTVMVIYVFPQFQAIFSGMFADGMESRAQAVHPLTMLMDSRGIIIASQLLLLLFVWCTAFIYMDGARFFPWLERALKPFLDRIFYALPWRRKRMQRDFSGMLAILLDAGMPEAEALAAAGDCTGNQIFRQRAQRAVAGLQNGMKLTEAVQKVDDSGEFQWRLTHALHAHSGFFKAMAGWNESLDAKAFQEEQATAQTVTTGIVVLNGLLVGFIVVTVFSMLISLINSAVLW